MRIRILGLAAIVVVCAATVAAVLLWPTSTHGSSAKPTVTVSPSASASPSPRFSPGNLPTPSFSDPVLGGLASALSGACNSAPQVCASFMASYTPSPSR